MNRKIFSIFLFITIIVTMQPLRSFANGDVLLTLEELRVQKGAITVEAYNIGQGFLVEPSLYNNGTLARKGIEY